MRIAATVATRQQPPRYMVQAIAMLLLSCWLCLALPGCATLQTPAAMDDTPLRERAVTATVRNVQVSAAVLSAEDNHNFFGTDLNDTGVQTVWVEIINHSPHTLWLLRSGTDPDYFSPLEVAWSYHGALSPDANSQIDAHFDRLSIDSLVPRGETRSGILYVNPHHGTRILNIDLLGQQTSIPFTLFPPVPGEQEESRLDEITAYLTKTSNKDYQDETAFRQALKQLPCCTTSVQAAVAGEPVNLVLIGKLTDIGATLIRRDYRHVEMPADTAQQLFGRPPDLVARKTGQGGVSANRIRLWAAPLRYQGQPVFVGQAGRPVGGRFIAADVTQPRLHPDVDESRSYLIQDLLYSGGLAQLGFVEDVPAVSAEQRRSHPGKFDYYTDGYRAVLFFVTRPLGLSDLEILDWDLLPRTRKQAQPLRIIRHVEHTKYGLKWCLRRENHLRMRGVPAGILLRKCIFPEPLVERLYVRQFAIIEIPGVDDIVVKAFQFDDLTGPMLIK